MHAYDRWLLARTAILSLILAIGVLAVVCVTDEPMSTAGMRVARMSALAPAIAALAVVIALARARARGELAALSALGSSPTRAALGALVAGWLVGALGLGLVLSPLADVSALFPAVDAPAHWIVEPTIMVAPPNGVSVTPDGVPTLGPVIVAGTPLASPPGRSEAALAILPLALAAPPWAAVRSAWWLRLLAGASVLFAVVFGLHAVAAERVAPAALLLSALPLVISLWAAARRSFA